MSFLKRYTNILLSSVSYVLLAFTIGAIVSRNASPSLQVLLVVLAPIMAILGIIFASKSKKLKESTWAGSSLKIIGILSLVGIVLLYLPFAIMMLIIRAGGY